MCKTELLLGVAANLVKMSLSPCQWVGVFTASQGVSQHCGMGGHSLGENTEMIRGKKGV